MRDPDPTLEACWTAGGWQSLTIGKHPHAATLLLHEVAAAVGAPPPDPRHAHEFGLADDRRPLDAALSELAAPGVYAGVHRDFFAPWRTFSASSLAQHPLRPTTFDEQFAGLLHATACALAFDPAGGAVTFSDGIDGHLIDAWRYLTHLFDPDDVVGPYPDDDPKDVAAAAAAWRTTAAAVVADVCDGPDRDAHAAAAWLVASTHRLDAATYDTTRTGRPTREDADALVATVAGALLVGVPSWRLAAAVNAAFGQLDTAAMPRGNVVV